MAERKKRAAQTTTTASFNGEEGAAAPSTPMERSDSIHLDPDNPPSGKMGEEVDPTDQAMLDAGYTKVVATVNFTAFGYGSGIYPLEKNKSTWVHQDHLDGMLRAGVIRELTDDDE